MNRHLDAGQTMEAAAGELNDEASKAHLDSCAECQARVEDWRDTIGEFRMAQESEHGEHGMMAEHPSAEELAGFAAGGVDPGGIIANHVDGCTRCASTLREALGAENDEHVSSLPVTLKSGTWAWQSDMAKRFAGQNELKGAHRPRPTWWRFAGVAAVLLLSVGGLGTWWILRRAYEPESLLAKVYTEARPFEFRLPDAGYGPVRQEKGYGSVFDRPEALIEAESAIRQRMKESPHDPIAVQLKGRYQLLVRDFDGAIESLTRASDARPGDLAALVDLGTAYAARGESDGRNLDYGHAVDLFLKVLKKQPGDQRVLFNLALTYEKLWLVDEALGTWRKLLAKEPDAGWRREASAHVVELEKVRGEHNKKGSAIEKDPAAFLARNRFAQDWNAEAFLDVFWTDWMPGVEASAERRDAASLVAQGLLSQSGDRSLVDLLQSGGFSLSALAHLAQAISANGAGESDAAFSEATEAAREFDSTRNQTASMRAGLEIAYASQRAAKAGDCAQISASIAGQADRVHYLWLGARAHLQHAACVDALAQPGPARAEIERVAGALRNSELKQTYLLAMGFITSIDDVTGNVSPVWDNAPQGLRVYWSVAASPYRAQQFQFNLKNTAERLGWRECAVALSRAALGSLRQVANPDLESINHVKLAVLLTELGERAERDAELDSALKLVTRLRPGPVRQHVNSVLALARAQAALADGRPGNVAAETLQIALSAGSLGSSDQTSVQRLNGEALFALGKWTDAAIAFQEAIRLNQLRVASISSAVERSAEIENAAAAYRDLTQIQLLQEHDAIKALETWKLFRGEKALSSTQAKVHTDVPIVTYAVLPVGIAVWLESDAGTTVRMISTPKPVQAAVRRLVSGCATPSPDESGIRESGLALYRWLIAPEIRQSRGSQILLRTDSWLSSIPFAALTDESGLYLNLSFSFSELTSREIERAGDSTPIAANSRALILAAPDALAPGRGRLPFLSATVDESRAVAERFTDAIMLRDSDATIETVSKYAPGASLFHFSGHGWSDGGSGALILPAGPEGEPRFITSRQLARQDWRHCSLAVLSACLTAIGEEHEAINSQSLVRALLSAGARRVVAARWNVDSAATAALMAGFYGELLRTHQMEPAALSAAARLVATQRNWRHPYFWAGFQVFGRF